MNEGDRNLLRTKDNILNSMLQQVPFNPRVLAELPSDAVVITCLDNAAQQCSKVFPPYLSGAIVAMLSDLAGAISGGETVRKDVAWNISIEILRMSNEV